ncbi:hypothetical protein ACYSNR_17530 [Enterococcus sp. LJL128]|uniref:hypothetical protein n=1 Tax=Enterococcus sp. LJL51 TaxID=3416656 RepID=UPI003CF958A3
MIFGKCKVCKEVPLFEGHGESNQGNALLLCRELVKEKKLSYGGGNCPLEKTEEILMAETQYTVSHFFRCRKCKQLFHLGFCIRGAPFLKKIKRISPVFFNK